MEPRAEFRRRTRLAPEARRKQLMECALEVFSKRGIGRAGHAEIAELAQVSVATVFNYFNTREDLVNAVLTEVELYFRGIASAAFVQSKDPMETIHDYIAFVVEAAYTKPDYTHIWLEWSSSVREEIWPRYLKLLAHNTELMKKVIKPGFDNNTFECSLTVDEFCRALTGCGYMIIQMINQPSNPSQEKVIEFVYNYITAILRPTAK
ncbi:MULTISPECIES: TetR/AcrR family transcriptional regulator [unclassified Motilimonas]|uniref:TetR/AcrR family transcriptional regulator n=1 Tax=Motilimonas TaxID=1914248 RepID=UPI001E5827BD|nr:MULTISPECIES: TetR/AcrR family transcriptional regulator [unclassified Motilimonas]MCE0558681.1 TetR/AcrR family transcriptional regulator [Motilimonas sp. E26]MDO6525711.1 TetR/AcrR family transcriptional regulator [Motilimonas sp. 1_MG-2023]